MRQKYIRFFISSTFADMSVERDLLQEVFNELIPAYRMKDWQIETVDLRWGISSEAGYLNKTMQICKKELLRCQQLSPKPNFIVLLGEYYGWVPLPESISASDCKKLSMTKKEKDVFEQWYILDNNVLPEGQYLLKGRHGRYRNDTNWQKEVEEPLKAMLSRNLRNAESLLGQIIKKSFSSQLTDYLGMSATEQEIRLGFFGVEDAGTHVLAYIRTLDNIPADKEKFYEKDKERADKSSRLREKVRAGLNKENIVEMSLPYREYGKDPFRNAFKERMRRHLTAIIERTIAENAHQSDNENDRHLEMAKKEAKFFIGRLRELEDIDRYLHDEREQRVLWVKAKSGAGKSSLLAKVVETYQNEFDIICRFCGRTEEASSASSLLQSLWWDLHLLDSSGKCKNPSGRKVFPYNGNEHWECMKCKLKHFNAKNPVLVIVDAVNQAKEDIKLFSELCWVDCALPPSLKVIISSTDEPRYNIPTDDLMTYTLHDMGEDAWTMVKETMRQQGRILDPAQTAQVQRVIGRSDRSPIYLNVLGKYLCTVPSTTSLHNVPPTLEELVPYILDKLSLAENHGPLIVRKVMSWLATEKTGLTQDEIMDLMSMDEDIFRQVKGDSFHNLPDNNGRRIPPILFSRLLSDLQPFLRNISTKTGQMLALFHDKLREAVAAGILDNSGKRVEAARSLFHYYSRHLGQKTFTEHALLEVISCGVELMHHAGGYNRDLFNDTGNKILGLLTKNATFLTLKALRHPQKLMDDYMRAMPFFSPATQRSLLSTQQQLARAIELLKIEDDNQFIEEAENLPNEEHFYRILKNLPTNSPLRQNLERFTGSNLLMDNILADGISDKADGTAFIIPELGKCPRLSADGKKIAALFQNRHQIKVTDLQNPNNTFCIESENEWIIDMQLSDDMSRVAFRTPSHYILFDCKEDEELLKGPMSEDGDVSLSGDGNTMAVYCEGTVEVISCLGDSLEITDSGICAKISPSGRYLWLIDSDYALIRYDIQEDNIVQCMFLDPERIKPQTHHEDDKSFEKDICQTAIMACSDTGCGIDEKGENVLYVEYVGNGKIRYTRFNASRMAIGADGLILTDFLTRWKSSIGSRLFRWDGMSWKQEWFANIIWTCASHDMRYILAETEPFACVIDISKATQQFIIKSEGNTGVNSLACTYDGKGAWLAAGMHPDIDSQQQLITVEKGRHKAWTPPFVREQYNFIGKVAVAPNGSVMAMSSQIFMEGTGCELLLCTPLGKRIASFETGNRACIAIAFSEDSNYLLAKTGAYLPMEVNPAVFLISRHGEVLMNWIKNNDMPINDFCSFSRNNRYALFSHGYDKTRDLCIDLTTGEDAIIKTKFFRFLSCKPTGMMRIKSKFFVVQPPVANGFFAINENGDFDFINLDTFRHSTFKNSGKQKFMPMACSPSGRKIYMHHDGELWLLDWLETGRMDFLINRVQWVLPAIDDDHCFIIRDDYMILLFNIRTRKVEQDAFFGRTVYQQVCAQGLMVANDRCEVALYRPDPSLHVNTPAPVSFVRHWDLKTHKLQDPIAVCPSCGYHIPLSQRLRPALRSAPRDIDEIRDGDWEDSRLHNHSCPHCHIKLSINPFVL